MNIAQIIVGIVFAVCVVAACGMLIWLDTRLTRIIGDLHQVKMQAVTDLARRTEAVPEFVAPHVDHSDALQRVPPRGDGIPPSPFSGLPLFAELAGPWKPVSDNSECVCGKEYTPHAFGCAQDYCMARTRMGL